MPLPARLGKATSARWAKGEEADLAADLAGRSGVALVAWEHKRIVESLLPSLLGPGTHPSVPAKWHGRRFDVAFRLDQVDPGAPWSFRQLMPCLLGGDSGSPM